MTRIGARDTAENATDTWAALLGDVLAAFGEDSRTYHGNWPLACLPYEQRLRSEWQALVSRRVKMEWAADRIYGGTCPFCRVLVGQPYYSDQYPPSWPEEYCDCIGDAMHLVESKRTTP